MSTGTTVKSLFDQRASKTGLITTVVDDDPPLLANMVALPEAKCPDVFYVNAIIDGEDATPRLLTGAYWFGYDPILLKAVLIKPVNDGYDVTISTGKAFGEVLALVAGLYSHIGIGKGTLAAGTAGLYITPLELQPG